MARDRTCDLPFPAADTLPTELPRPVWTSSGLEEGRWQRWKKDLES